MQQQRQQQQPEATVCLFVFMHAIEVFFKVLNMDFCKYTTINVTKGVPIIGLADKSATDMAILNKSALGTQD